MENLCQGMSKNGRKCNEYAQCKKLLICKKERYLYISTNETCCAFSLVYLQGSGLVNAAAEHLFECTKSSKYYICSSHKPPYPYEYKIILDKYVANFIIQPPKTCVETPKKLLEHHHADKPNLVLEIPKPQLTAEITKPDTTKVHVDLNLNRVENTHFFVPEVLQVSDIQELQKQWIYHQIFSDLQKIKKYQQKQQIKAKIKKQWLKNMNKNKNMTEDKVTILSSGHDDGWIRELQTVHPRPPTQKAKLKPECAIYS